MIIKSSQLERRRFLQLLAGGGTVLAAGGATAFLEACGGASPGASAPVGAKVSASLSDVAPTGNPELLAEQFFAKRVGDLTKGQYEIKVFGNSALGPQAQINEQVRNGTIEFGQSSLAFMSQFDKKMSIGSLPYLYSSQDKLYSALDGKFGKAIDQILQGVGFKVMYFANGGIRNVYNRKAAFTTPQDFKSLSLRIRVQPDPVFIDTFNLLGAKTITMGFDQVYSALQQGVVDGAENSITYYTQAHHDEVAKYVSQTQHAYGMDMLVASLKWWNQQPAASQKVILEAGKDAEANERKVLADGDKKITDQAKATGVKINGTDTAAFQRAVKPIMDKYATQFGDLLDIVKQTQ